MASPTRTSLYKPQGTDWAEIDDEEFDAEAAIAAMRAQEERGTADKPVKEVPAEEKGKKKKNKKRGGRQAKERALKKLSAYEERLQEWLERAQVDRPDVSRNDGVTALTEEGIKPFTVHEAYGQRKYILQTDVEAGAELIAEAPLVRVANSQDSAAILKSYHALGDEDKANYDALPPRLTAPSVEKAFPAAAYKETAEALGLEDRASRILNIFGGNLRTISPDPPFASGIFYELTLVPHACNPNAYMTWDMQRQKFVLRARNNIKKGEEVTYSKLQDWQLLTRLRRQIQLGQEGWGECTCHACTANDGENMLTEIRRAEAYQLHQDWSAAAKAGKPLPQIKQLFDQLIANLAQDGGPTFYTSFFYAQMAQLADDAHALADALAYRRRECALDALLLGPENPETRRTRAQIRDLEARLGGVECGTVEVGVERGRGQVREV